MSEQTNQEPTMEEILASIRRIISEDDPPAEGAAAEADAPSTDSAPSAEAAPPPDAAPEPQLSTEDDDDAQSLEDDVIELTQRVEPEPPSSDTMGDLEVFAPAAHDASSPVRDKPAPEPAPPPAAAPAGDSEDEALVGSPAAASAASAFAALSRSIAMPSDGLTLDAVVRDLLRPLMKQWLDENLPRIVEAAVQAEVERIARQRR